MHRTNSEDQSKIIQSIAVQVSWQQGLVPKGDGGDCADRNSGGDPAWSKAD